VKHRADHLALPASGAFFLVDHDDFALHEKLLLLDLLSGRYRSLWSAQLDFHFNVLMHRELLFHPRSEHSQSQEKTSREQEDAGGY